MAKATVNLVTTVGAFTGSGDISFPQGLNLPSGTTVEGVGLLTQNTATTANIGAILNAGVNGIAAALGNKQYTMTLLSNTATFSDSRAVYNGVSQAAITAGVYTPGIAINAIGVGMGANRPSDGQWVNTVYIDASTGSATFLGTLTAGSVISGSVTNSGTGNSLNIIDGNASTALSNANTALTTKLNKSASDILSGAISVTTSGGFVAGTLTWNSSGVVTGGSGIAITSAGIVGNNGTSNTFTIDTSGNATFYGNISGGANINITGTGIFEGATSTPQGTAAISCNRNYGASLAGAFYSNSAAYPTIWAYNGAAGGVCLETSGTVQFQGPVEFLAASGAVYFSYAPSFNLTTAAPFSVSSDTLVTNLNSQFWNGLDATGFSSTATAGTATLPASPAGFIEFTVIGGGTGKIPYYNV